MKRGVICLTLLSFAVAGMLFPTAASASEADAASTVTVTSTGDGILWVEASIEQADVTSLRVKLFSPKKKAGRKIFQICKFNFSGAGTYRCGIDVAAGSLARKVDGSWKTSVWIDGEVVVKEAFRL